MSNLFLSLHPESQGLACMVVVTFPIRNLWQQGLLPHVVHGSELQTSHPLCQLNTTRSSARPSGVGKKSEPEPEGLRGHTLVRHPCRNDHSPRSSPSLRRIGSMSRDPALTFPLRLFGVPKLHCQSWRQPMPGCRSPSGPTGPTHCAGLLLPAGTAPGSQQ